MNNATVTRDTVMPPPSGRHGVALLLALLAHGALVALLALGLRWTANAPDGEMSAEVWNISAQEGAAATSQRAPVEPAPAQTKPAPPTEEVLAAAAARKLAEAKAAKQEADRKAEQEAEIALRRQRELAQREQQAKAAAQAQQQAQKKAEQEEKERLAEEAKRQEQKVKARAAQEAKDKVTAQPNTAQKSQQAMWDKLLAKEGNAANAKGQQGSGAAARSGGKGLSDAYKRKIANAVRPNIQFSSDEDDRLSADVEVRASPTGEIIGRRLVRSSGDRIYDNAVLRALDRTGRLPKDENGQVPVQFTAAFSWP